MTHVSEDFESCHVGFNIWIGLLFCQILVLFVRAKNTIYSENWTDQRVS